MISPEERNRRYQLIREAMQQKGYAALIIAGNTESTQLGYIRYVSDWRLWGGTGFVVLPLESEPVIILGKGSQYYWAKQEDWVTDVRAGLNKLDVVATILAERKISAKKIGVVGYESIMTWGDVKQLQNNSPQAVFEDATDLMDEIVAIKSKEEIEQISLTYNLLAEAMHKVTEALKPGKTERSVMAEAIYYLGAHGCYHGIAHIGQHAAPSIRPATDRILTKEDILNVSLEWLGPSGYWMELSSVYSFRQPTEEMIHYYETMYKAVYHAISLMKPGAVAGDVSRAAWKVFEDEGYKIKGRLIWDFHGIGVNVMSDPIGLSDSKDIFKENMVINLHPGPAIDGVWGVCIQENIVVTPQGGRVLGNYEHKWRVIS